MTEAEKAWEDYKSEMLMDPEMWSVFLLMDKLTREAGFKPPIASWGSHEPNSEEEHWAIFWKMDIHHLELDLLEGRSELFYKNFTTREIVASEEIYNIDTIPPRIFEILEDLSNSRT